MPYSRIDIKEELRTIDTSVGKLIRQVFQVSSNKVDGFGGSGPALIMPFVLVENPAVQGDVFSKIGSVAEAYDFVLNPFSDILEELIFLRDLDSPLKLDPVVVGDTVSVTTPIHWLGSALLDDATLGGSVSPSETVGTVSEIRTSSIGEKYLKISSNTTFPPCPLSGLKYSIFKSAAPNALVVSGTNARMSRIFPNSPNDFVRAKLITTFHFGEEQARAFSESLRLQLAGYLDLIKTFVIRSPETNSPETITHKFYI